MKGESRVGELGAEIDALVWENINYDEYPVISFCPIVFIWSSATI